MTYTWARQPGKMSAFLGASRGENLPHIRPSFPSTSRLEVTPALTTWDPSSPGLRQPRRRTRVRAGPGGVNGAPSFVLGLHHLADSTGTRDPGLGSRQVDEYLTFQARPKQPAWITPDHVDKEYVTSARAAPFTGATSWKGRRVLPRPWLRPRPSNRQAAPP